MSATAARFLLGWSDTAHTSVSCAYLVKVAHVLVLITRTLLSRVNMMKFPHGDIRKLSQDFLMTRELVR
jgi:hypothetical protein